MEKITDEKKVKFIGVLEDKDFTIEIKPIDVNFVRRKSFGMGQPCYLTHFVFENMPADEIDEILALDTGEPNSLKSFVFGDAEGNVFESFTNAGEDVLDYSINKEFYNALNDEKALILDIKVYIKG